MLRRVLYDRGGFNLGLFHCINDWRGEALDRVTVLGTHVSDYRNFPIYVTLMVAGA